MAGAGNGSNLGGLSYGANQNAGQYWMPQNTGGNQQGTLPVPNYGGQQNTGGGYYTTPSYGSGQYQQMPPITNNPGAGQQISPITYNNPGGGTSTFTPPAGAGGFGNTNPYGYQPPAPGTTTLPGGYTPGVDPLYGQAWLNAAMQTPGFLRKFAISNSRNVPGLTHATQLTPQMMAALQQGAASAWNPTTHGFTNPVSQAASQAIGQASAYGNPSGVNYPGIFGGENNYGATYPTGAVRRVFNPVTGQIDQTVY